MSSLNTHVFTGVPYIKFVWPKSRDTMMIIIGILILFSCFMSVTRIPFDPAKVTLIPLISMLIMTTGFLLFYFRGELKENIKISNKVLTYLYNHRGSITIEDIADGINYHELNKLAARLEELIGKGYIKEEREITYALAKR